MSTLPPVSLAEFEGPFDLLIELAQQSKFDLSQVSLSKLTDAYIAVLNKHELQEQLRADFLIVASTLLLLKVRQLLPELEPEEELEIQQLTDRVRIYQLYREQAQKIMLQWRNALLPGPERLATNQPLLFPSITHQEFSTTMAAIIARITPPRHVTRHLRLRGKTMQECVALLRQRLAAAKPVIFQEALAGETRDTVAVSFLAALELARQRDVQLNQPKLFAPLTLTSTPRA